VHNASVFALYVVVLGLTVTVCGIGDKYV